MLSFVCYNVICVYLITSLTIFFLIKFKTSEYRYISNNYCNTNQEDYICTRRKWSIVVEDIGKAGRWSTLLWHKVVFTKEYNILPKNKGVQQQVYMGSLTVVEPALVYDSFLW